jgi:hypothetical protein
MEYYLNKENFMKKIITTLIVIPALLLLACGAADTIFKTLEKSKLAPPLGLESITQNGQVTLLWYTSNYEKDFGGYFIFQAEGNLEDASPDSALSNVFVKVDSVPINDASGTNFSNGVVTKVRSGLTNGKTYSFAIVAYNKKNMKKISYPSNIITDTPRPEISTVTIKSAKTAQVVGNNAQAGFDFDSFTVVEVPVSVYTSTNGADIVNEAFDPSKGTDIRLWLAGMNGAGIQDLGYMENLDKSDVAPLFGYSQQGKSIAVTLGHVFAIKTGGNKFGKIIITSIGDSPDYALTFNAAFQTLEGNQNYKVVPLDYMLGLH